MAEAFVFASLVHDLGHWPFCHPIEDMQLAGLGEHETRVAAISLMVRGAKDLMFKERLPGESFEADVVNKYGRTLYEIFFKPYTEKFLFYSPPQLHRDWARAGLPFPVAVLVLRMASWSIVVPAPDALLLSAMPSVPLPPAELK